MILDDIMRDKRKELADTVRCVPLERVKSMAAQQPPARDFARAIKGDRVRLIAEIKRASPSRGMIAAEFDPISIARTYVSGGAAAISVLTESTYFLGKLEYLDLVRGSLGEESPPLLRKDFIFDEYQVFEARAHGADALLLIVAAISPQKLKQLIGTTHSLGMECLVEVHSAAELRIAIACGARVVGVNNRDLHTFNVDLATTERLIPLLPSDRIAVSESGISTRADVERMRRCGADAVLVGEALMSAPDIAARMRELL